MCTVNGMTFRAPPCILYFLTKFYYHLLPTDFYNMLILSSSFERKLSRYCWLEFKSCTQKHVRDNVHAVYDT